ncbi:MAG: hypothetical protein KDC54_04290 [Lewinella sp.]|nr:hypothetical protein [Lewinella sp.]
MRYLTIVSLLALLAWSCEPQQEIGLLDSSTLKFYAITACGMETDLGAETPAEWADRMADFATNAGLTVLAYELQYEAQPIPEYPICGNCNRTGDVVHLTVPDEQESALRELGFVDL